MKSEWKILATGIFIFSGTLLIFSFVPPVWTFFSKKIKNLIQAFSAKKLSELETELILILAEYADESLDLKHLNYKGDTSKLEILGVSQSLSSKGLVRINPFEENLITLSDSGRKKALQLITMNQA